MHRPPVCFYVRYLVGVGILTREFEPSDKSGKKISLTIERLNLELGEKVEGLRKFCVRSFLVGKSFAIARRPSNEGVEIKRLNLIVRELERTAVQLEYQIKCDAERKSTSPFALAATRNLTDLRRAIAQHSAQIAALRKPAH
jgi:hypothetical protein